MSTLQCSDPHFKFEYKYIDEKVETEGAHICPAYALPRICLISLKFVKSLNQLSLYIMTRWKRRGSHICSAPVFPPSVHFPPSPCHPSTLTGNLTAFIMKKLRSARSIIGWWCHQMTKFANTKSSPPVAI